MSDPADESVVPKAEAGWFGPEDRPRFGWLHRASRPSATALVIVPPFGYEAVCVQRSLRHLAEDAAAAGIAAVRFDLDGTGDSVGSDLDPARLDAWLASIDAACSLARDAGAARLVLVGLRLGATLATLAAARRDDVAALVLINPVLRGRAFLREARALQAALNLAPAPTADADDVQELVGYAISAETRGALNALDLGTLDTCPAPRVLLLERDDMPSTATASERWRSLGAEVEVQRVPGYAEMMLDPHDARVPQALLDAVLGYVSRLPPEVAVPACAALSLRTRIEQRVEGQRIESCTVPVAPGLFGIASRPMHGASGRAILLFNSGGIARIGPNRLYLPLAAHFAAHGDTVLRIDLSGIGDSRHREDGQENTVYHPRNLEDVAACVAWARAQGAVRVVAGGLCSAGYHALKAAIAGQAIDVVLMVNPLTFNYQPGIPAHFSLRRDSERYGRKLHDRSAWGKLLRGEVSLLRVARVLAWRAWTAFKPRGVDVMRRLRVPLQDDLGSQLAALGRAGKRIEFIFASDDPGPSMLAEHAGAVVPRMVRAGQARVQTIVGPDHAFTPRWAQPRLVEAIYRALADGSSP